MNQFFILIDRVRLNTTLELLNLLLAKDVITIINRIIYDVITMILFENFVLQ